MQVLPIDLPGGQNFGWPSTSSPRRVFLGCAGISEKCKQWKISFEKLSSGEKKNTTTTVKKNNTENV